MVRANAPFCLRFALGALLTAAFAAAPACNYLDQPTIDNPPPPTSATRLGAVCAMAVESHSPTYYQLGSNTDGCFCIRPPEQKMTDTTALCSQECQVDADCQGGQTRNAADPMDRRCQGGFSCQAYLPAVSGTSAPVPCHKICACNDFIDQSHPPFSCSP